MASSFKHPYLTPEEYLEAERKAEFRSEYVAGEVFAMAGGTGAQVAIAFIILGFLWNRLKNGPCRAFSSNMKVYLRDDARFCYPDVTVCCGKPVFHDDVGDVLLNPTVVFEVLSKSTKSYDLGDKSFYYRRSASLRHVVLVYQERGQVSHWMKEGADGPWSFAEYSHLADAIPFPELNTSLSLTEIYENALRD